MLAEIGTEANPRRENLNYTPAGLIGTFSYFRAHVDEAQLYGRTADHPANQPAIANRAYANRIGNGNIASGDGWAYRGGGCIQVTGRANYQAVQNETNARFPGAGVDVIADPDQATTTTRGGLISAMAFWTGGNLNGVADGGAEDSDVDNVTDIVNRYTDSRQQRIDNFHTTRDIFHVAECPH